LGAIILENPQNGCFGGEGEKWGHGTKEEC